MCLTPLARFTNLMIATGPLLEIIVIIVAIGGLIAWMLS